MSISTLVYCEQLHIQLIAIAQALRLRTLRDRDPSPNPNLNPDPNPNPNPNPNGIGAIAGATFATSVAGQRYFGHAGWRLPFFVAAILAPL